MRWAICGIALFLVGCAGPTLFRVETDNRVRMDGPMRGSFAADLPAVRSTEPLEFVEAEGGSGVAGTHTTFGPRVALIDVDGLLINANQTGLYSHGENPVALFREKLDRCAADAEVVAVVLRINSPGGSVAATDMMVHDLRAFRQRTGKPVVACLMDLGCGGGYALASGAQHVVAQGGTIVGGLGVVLNLYNLQDFMATFNVVGQSVKAGPLVDMGSPAKAMSPEARAMLQAMADEYHDHLRTLIREQRPGLSAIAEEAFDGRIMTARQALGLGLVDQVAPLEVAIESARRLAAQPAARLVLLRRPGESARTPYAIVPNTPLQSSLMPLSIPGIDRSKLPTFLYAWLPEPTLERLAAGK
ncbi:MAG TPA: S49 family peptidase [Gemmatales bacterium]|nr:S49 family peptidase [Gemmatales bacterium]HMP60017.1 S49 family peptidase [Gemmatales bacterium]